MTINIVMSDFNNARISITGDGKVIYKNELDAGDLEATPNSPVLPGTTTVINPDVNEYLRLSGGTMLGSLHLSGEPVEDNEAATKQYVDTALNDITLPNLTDYVEKSGATMTGALTLFGLPTQPFHAAPKSYVDSRIASVDQWGSLSMYVQKSGATMTGPLVLANHPTVNKHPATKLYVDNAIAGLNIGTYINRSGGVMMGALSLTQEPTEELHAATKAYVDTAIANLAFDGEVDSYLPISGGTLTGTLTLAGSPVSGLDAATKSYVDITVASIPPVDLSDYVSRSGTTMTGPLTLAASPTANMHAVTKVYVDNAISSIPTNDLSNFVPKSGSNMSGPLTLYGNPTSILHAATKGYVDSVVAAIPAPDLSSYLPLSGGSMSGSLILSSDPILGLQAATKQYVDETVSGINPDLSDRVSKNGDTMSGALILAGEPILTNQAATKGYVDNSITNLSIASYVAKNGSTMTGPLILSGTPTLSLQATPKNYVDGIVATRLYVDIQTWNIPSLITRIFVSGYALPNDGGSANYVNVNAAVVSSLPTNGNTEGRKVIMTGRMYTYTYGAWDSGHTCYVQSADGRYWELDEHRVRPEMKGGFGVNTGTPTVSCSAPMNALLEFLKTRNGGIMDVSNRRFLIDADVIVPENCQLVGVWTGVQEDAFNAGNPVNYAAFPALIITPTASIWMSARSSWSGVTFISSLLNIPQTKRQTIDMVKNFVNGGIALRVGGTAVNGKAQQVHGENSVFLGFNTAVLGDDSPGLRMQNCYADGLNGFEIRNSNDNPFFCGCHHKNLITRQTGFIDDSATVVSYGSGGSSPATGKIILTGQPTNNSTITLNGYVFTFRTTGFTAANRVEIGSDYRATCYNLFKKMKASVDTRITAADYTFDHRDQSINIMYRTAVSGVTDYGNAYTLASTSNRVGWHENVLRGTVQNPTLTIGNSFTINGTSVSVSDTTVSALALKIRDASITNITARVNGLNQLEIVNRIGGAITLVETSGLPLTALGMATSVAARTALTGGGSPMIRITIPSAFMDIDNTTPYLQTGDTLYLQSVSGSGAENTQGKWMVVRVSDTQWDLWGSRYDSSRTYVGGSAQHVFGARDGIGFHAFNTDTFSLIQCNMKGPLIGYLINGNNGSAISCTYEIPTGDEGTTNHGLPATIQCIISGDKFKWIGGSFRTAETPLIVTEYMATTSQISGCQFGAGSSNSKTVDLRRGTLIMSNMMFTGNISDGPIYTGRLADGLLIGSSDLNQIKFVGETTLSRKKPVLTGCRNGSADMAASIVGSSWELRVTDDTLASQQRVTLSSDSGNGTVLKARQTSQGGMLSWESAASAVTYSIGIGNDEPDYSSSLVITPKGTIPNGAIIIGPARNATQAFKLVIRSGKTTPNSSARIANIPFVSNTTDGSALTHNVEYASIDIYTPTVTTGAHAGEIGLSVASNGTLTKRVTVNSRGTFLNGILEVENARYYLQASTTDATPKQMTRDGGAASTTNIPLVPTGKAYMVRVIVKAREASPGTASAAWNVMALISREGNAAATTLIGGGGTGIIPSFSGGSGSAWLLSVTADTTRGGVNVSITGAVGKTISWEAEVSLI